MQYEFIATPEALASFCEQIATARVLAFDTEFVSEDSFRPELCLVQVAADDRLAVIDPQTIDSLAPFWERVVSAHHRTVVHAGAEEMRFCLRGVGKLPPQLIDVQLAAGLIGLEYPASYGTLVSRLLGRSLPKGETRSDWRRRPLSPRQLEYALHDVFYLERLGLKLEERLVELGRLSWLDDEMHAWLRRLSEAELGERWTRLPGLAGLDSRPLAIARALCAWRDSEGERRNQPARRILRDDLIVELAKRETSDIKRIRSLRGMERGDLQRHIPALSVAIEGALQLPKDQLPSLDRRPARNQLTLLGQFLSTALGSICRAAQVSPSLVGTTQDMRDLAAWHLGQWDEPHDVPALARGWRKEVVGQVIADILSGRLSVAIDNPLADEPLVFEPRAQESRL